MNKELLAQTMEFSADLRAVRVRVFKSMDNDLHVLFDKGNINGSMVLFNTPLADENEPPIEIIANLYIGKENVLDTLGLVSQILPFLKSKIIELNNQSN